MESAQRTNRRLFSMVAFVTIGLVVFLLINIAISYLNLRSAIESQRAVGRSIDRLRAISKLLSIVQDAETGQRGFLITGDEQYLKPYDAALDKIIETRRRLNTLVAGQPELGELNQELGLQIDAALAELADTIALLSGSGSRRRSRRGSGRRWQTPNGLDSRADGRDGTDRGEPSRRAAERCGNAHSPLDHPDVRFDNIRAIRRGTRVLPHPARDWCPEAAGRSVAGRRSQKERLPGFGRPRAAQPLGGNYECRRRLAYVRNLG